MCVGAALAPYETGPLPQCEEEWRFVLERCLQIDPDRRASMREVCDLLERIAAL